MFPSSYHYHHHHPSQTCQHASLDYGNRFLAVLCEPAGSVYAGNAFLFHLVELDSSYLYSRVTFCSPNLVKCLSHRAFCYLPLLQYTCPSPTYFAHFTQGLSAPCVQGLVCVHSFVYTKLIHAH